MCPLAGALACGAVRREGHALSGDGCSAAFAAGWPRLAPPL